jgi:hypothetical protein
METLQKLDISEKLTGVSQSNVNEPLMVESNTNFLELGKTLLIILILLVFAFYILRYLANYTTFGQNIKSQLQETLSSIEIGGKKIFSGLEESRKAKKEIINEASTNLKELENAINTGAKSVNTNVNKYKLATKKNLYASKDVARKMKTHAINMPDMPDMPKRKTKKQLSEDSLSNPIQKRGKTGHCFIGNDRGYRSCMEIDEMDKCVSNQIFPTRELCINPTLRV